MRVRVSDNIQVNHEGRVYGGGEELEVDEREGRRLILLGYASEVPSETPQNALRSAQKGRRERKG